MAKYQNGKRQISVGIYDHSYMPCLEQNFEAKCCNYRCEQLINSTTNSYPSMADKLECDSCPPLLQNKCYNEWNNFIKSF